MVDITIALFSGLIAGACSMLIYMRLTPQQKLASIKAQIQQSRQAIAAYDGDMKGLFPLIGKDLSITFRQIRLVFLPAVISIAPCIAPFFLAPHLLAATNSLIAYFCAILVISIYLKIKLRIL
jgi:hypothetical protein